MKKIALSFAALALTAGSALAADLPTRKGPPVLPPPPPPPLWTGFYVGLNAGGGWANNNTINTVAFPAAGTIFAGPLAFEPALSASGSFTSGGNGGFIGGGQVGYNFQFYNSFVAGIEADIQGIAGSSGGQNRVSAVPSTLLAPFAWTTVSQYRGSIDYLGTVRGRLGWLATPTLLIYGTGGLAYGGVNLNAAQITTLSGLPGLASLGATSFSDTRVGWTAGGGIEWMFWPNWSAKAEYLYYDLGSVTTSGVSVEPTISTWGYATQSTARFNGNIIRAGLNYHFNWAAPAPVVAKY
jgi:outer membrane immunogenic protein